MDKDIKPLSGEELLAIAKSAQPNPNGQQNEQDTISEQQRKIDAFRAKMRKRPSYLRLVELNNGVDPDLDALRTGSIVPTKAPECATCGDTGFVRADLPVGDPNFGRPIPCTCMQRRLTERKQTRAQSIADLTAEMENMTFASFEQKYDIDAYEAARAFVDGGDDIQPWLCFEGPPGGGKTHLLAAIAHEMISRGEIVMFRVVPRLFDWFRSAFDSEGMYKDGFQQRFDEVCNVPVLLLDDMGAEKQTDWTQEKLFTILNFRYARRLRTAISTNLKVMEFEPRIRSRILDMEVCEAILTTDQDYRRRKGRRVRRSDERKDAN